MPLLLALLACRPVFDPATDPPADPLTDQIAASAAGDCARIVDPDMRAECAVFAVRADPARAADLCPQISVPFWQDECWFMAADAADLLGEERRIACMRAGRYQGPCIANALSREITRLTEDPGSRCRPGLQGEVERVLAGYHRPAAQAEEIVRRVQRGC